MSQQNKRKRRTTVEWTVRAILALLIVAVGYFSASRTLATALSPHRSEQAYNLAPEDGRIAGEWAERLALVAAVDNDRKRADVLARKALRNDATAVEAVNTIALNAHLRGDESAARRLFGYAERLSRRELLTQLWAVEDAARRSDIRGVLTHYDVALRTSQRAKDVMFPKLAAVIGDRNIRAGLVNTLAARPLWATAFVDYVASEGPDPRATASLLIGLREVKYPVSDFAESTAVDGLLNGGFPDQAWGYYAAIRPGADRRTSRNERFRADRSSPSLLDWTTVNGSDASAAIRSGSFDFVASSSLGGPLLQQIQLLPPGDYRLEGHGTGIEQPDRAPLFWILKCRSGRELGRIAVANSSQANGIFKGRFHVPAGCPVQSLVLVSQPSEGVTGVSGRIDRIRLYPAGGAP